MDKINYICPTCRTNNSTLKCSHCNYDLDVDKLLYNLVIENYNLALDLVNKKELISSYNLINKSILLFPYIPSVIKFCFWLSIEIGYYQQAQNLLNHIKDNIADEEYEELKDELYDSLEIYNSILLDKLPKQQSYSQLNLVHLYLLYLKTKDKNKKYKYLTYISSIDTSISSVSNKKGVSFVLYSILAIFIVMLFYGYYSYSNLIQQNKELSLEYDKIQTSIRTSAEKNIIELNDSQIEQNQISDWYVHFINHEYTYCGKQLLEKDYLKTLLFDNTNIDVLDELTSKLFVDSQYAILIDLDIECDELPHAYYHLANRYYSVNIEKRIEMLEIFVKRYSNYHIYTGYYLRELVDYYRHTDNAKATMYANLLLTWVKRISPEDSSIYISSEIIEITR